MKSSLHAGRKGRAKHNDHNFKSDHINAQKTDKNVIFLWSDSAENCHDAEVEIFNKLYSDALSKQNEKYRKKGQYNRVKKMEDWVECSRYCAREEILQIGDMKSHASAEALEQCLDEYAKWKEEQFGSNFSYISIALHVDEATPHAHCRETWFYHDKDGTIKPGIAKALEEAGIPLPDDTKPVSRTNNRMMTYTEICRDVWQQICIEHGFNIDCTPDKSRTQGHMGSKQYKAYMQAMEALEAREKAVEAREKRLALQEMSLQDREKAIEQKEKDFQHWEDALDAQAKAINNLPPLTDDAVWVFDHAYVKLVGKDGKPRAKLAKDYLEDRKKLRSEQVKRREIPDYVRNSGQSDKDFEY